MCNTMSDDKLPSLALLQISKQKDTDIDAVVSDFANAKAGTPKAYYDVFCKI